jgi:hypothetical protein
MSDETIAFFIRAPQPFHTCSVLENISFFTVTVKEKLRGICHDARREGCAPL